MMVGYAEDTATWQARRPAREIRRVVPRTRQVQREASRIKTEHDEHASAFLAAFSAALEAAEELAANDEADRPDRDLWTYAIQALWPFVGLVDAPLVCPLQMGGLSVEWHDHGLNIEIRFRGPKSIFVVVEDARCILEEFMEFDQKLLRGFAALHEMSSRMA